MSHAALDFARPSGSPKSDEVKGFLRGFALAVSCVVSDPTSRLESLDSVFCDLVWSARARRQLRHAMLALCLGHANAIEDQISVAKLGCVFACAAC